MQSAFIKSGTIVDANFATNGAVNVKLKVSTETRDKEGDLFLKSAWTNQEDIDFFKNKGYYDYHHLSEILSYSKSKDPDEVIRSQQNRLKAIIGYPVKDKALYSENGDLYSEGTLDSHNEFVKPIVSLLKSGFDRFECSAAGVMYHPSAETIDAYGQKTYDRARINHIAICPTNEAINPDTKVMLMKSLSKQFLKSETEPNNYKLTVISDPIEEYISQSDGYQDWVLGKLNFYLENDQIPRNFESLVKFLENHKISKENAEKAVVIILGD